MSGVISWLEGKKTYVTAIVIGVVATARALGYEIPEWTFELLAALGLGFLRAGVARASA